MVELEADDGLASAARLAEADDRVEKVCIWTPDKDLAQCVRGERVVQVDRRGKKVRDEEGVREKFGVVPSLIPDYLALVGDAADGFPANRRHRRGDGGAAPEPTRPHRGLPRVRARRGPRAGPALQGSGDAADRGTPVPGRRRAAVERARRPPSPRSRSGSASPAWCPVRARPRAADRRPARRRRGRGVGRRVHSRLEDGQCRPPGRRATANNDDPSGIVDQPSTASSTRDIAYSVALSGRRRNLRRLSAPAGAPPPARAARLWPGAPSGRSSGSAPPSGGGRAARRARARV